MTRLPSLILGLCLGPLACGSGATESPPTTDIPASAFALVGDEALHRTLLDRAVAENESSQIVAEKAQWILRNELFRKEAERLDPHRTSVVRRAVLARRLIEQTEGQVSESARPGQLELEQEYRRRWLDYDRPRAVRTVQVLFAVPPLAPDQAILEKAQRVREAVRGAHNLEEFAARARPLIGEDKEVFSYDMPPLATDGRIVPSLPQDFQVEGISEILARAAGSLENPGEISDVVGSEYGFHIFFATEVIPEQRVPFDAVTAELERAVLGERVRQELDKISKNGRVPVERRREDISRLLTLVQQGK
jgi:hypothetical protein